MKWQPILISVISLLAGIGLMWYLINERKLAKERNDNAILIILKEVRLWIMVVLCFMIFIFNFFEVIFGD